MKKEELLELGFKDKSCEDFEQFTLDINDFVRIEYSNLFVDIFVFDHWVNVPNCKTIADMKNLIKLFS